MTNKLTQFPFELLCLQVFLPCDLKLSALTKSHPNGPVTPGTICPSPDRERHSPPPHRDPPLRSPRHRAGSDTGPRPPPTTNNSPSAVPRTPLQTRSVPTSRFPLRLAPRRQFDVYRDVFVTSRASQSRVQEQRSSSIKHVTPSRRRLQPSVSMGCVRQQNHGCPPPRSIQNSENGVERGQTLRASQT